VIEEELEMLYDAYYEELENFEEGKQKSISSPHSHHSHHHHHHGSCNNFSQKKFLFFFKLKKVNQRKMIPLILARV
jgi:hypothetical protein